MKFDQRLFAEARHHQRLLVLAIAAGTAGGALMVGQAWLLSQAISRVFLDQERLSDVAPLLWVALGLLLLRSAASWVSAAAAGQIAARLKHSLRLRLFDQLARLGPAYLAGERTGELSNLLTEGIAALDAYFRQYLPRLALAVLVPVTLLIFIFPIDLLSGVVLLLTAPLIPLFMSLIGGAAGAVSRKRWLALSRLSAHFLDVMQGLPTLKMFGQSRAQIETIGAASERFRITTMGVLRVAFLSAFTLEMIGTISTAVIAVQVGLRLLFDTISFEQALFVLILAPEFYLPMRELGMSFHAASSGSAAAERLFEVLALQVRSAPTQKPISADTFGPIRFEQVSLTYRDESGGRGGLHEVSFTLNPGEHLVVVGPIGAGKSSLAHLLLGFRQPDRGRIVIGETSLADIPPKVWLSQVAWVPQSPYLIYGSVIDNIRLGRPDASMDEVQYAAKLAHADGFIHALPQGYDSLIGERGARLSGGQAQRIALARAFLIDARLVILDEPTTHLDGDTKVLIADSIANLIRGRSTLIITHDLRGIPGVDRILVLEAGRIVESGQHKALLQTGGVYARLWAAHHAAG